MTKIVFHGTSIQFARSIIKEGFKPKVRNWKVSTELAYFYNIGDYKQALTTALIQGGVAAFKNITECRRSVLAIRINDKDISQDATRTAGPYAYQYNGKTILLKSIVGFWHDIYNLRDVRPFVIYNQRHLKYKIHQPKLIPELEGFFKEPENPISVPIKQVFCNFDLGFNIDNEKFIV